MKSVAERLLIKPGAGVLLISPGLDGPSLVGPLPYGARWIEPSASADVVVLFVRNAAELRDRLPAAAAAASGDRLLWLAYPKLSSGIATDLARDTITPLTDPLAGLTGMALIAIDSTWSAMRLLPSARYQH
ncbi:MAG: hypothetical protein ACHQXL_03500 [Candidatus Limnocylindrales bacterium]